MWSLVLLFFFKYYIRSSVLLLNCPVGVQMQVSTQSSGTTPLFSFAFLPGAGLSFSIY